ncbi:MAG: hypothetical protein ACF8XB_02675, partial [Planctomycetota bacterium JB042]
MAKAKLRMARIAGARGDREAERGWMEEVVERFAGTPAAAEAAAALEEGAGAGAGTADAAVAEARAFLDEMLEDENRITPTKANLVFKTLSVEEIVGRYRLKGGAVWTVVRRVSDPALAPDLVEFVERAPDFADSAIRALAEVAPGASVPAPVVEIAERDPNIAWRVIRMLVDTGELGRAAAVFRNNESLSSIDSKTFRDMVEVGSADAATLVELFVGRMREGALNLGQHFPENALGAENAVGERMRSLFPTW